MNDYIALTEIIDYYLNSEDFNGLPILKMSHYNEKELFELIDRGMIEVISENEVLNPHIRGFNLNISIEVQKKYISDKKTHACLYPTETALKEIEVDYKSPYTVLMQSGRGQFDIIYFDIEILERYINNPKYIVYDSGYRGTIEINHDFYNEYAENEYIKDYGMAYVKDEPLIRSMGVFLIDLSNLPPKIQMLWNAYELENQKLYTIEEGFIKNLLHGEWVTKYWIFHALIDEMIIVNEQCKAMGIPSLFSKTFGTHYFDMPEGYRNILLPTMKNYYDFVLVMEKMFVHNISVKTFQKDEFLIKKIERKDENGNPKGSLVMFQEWLSKNIRTSNNLNLDIIQPLKNIRKIRQVPAHELTNNKYDTTLYEKQRDLVIETYTAVRNIRLIFSNHPLGSAVEIPKQLISGENIVYY
ncbi:hypothetical protein [Exiguobacterium sp. K1]|uniref:hypothetical protein n=1 Tax=Exiguobacterium sp. K1 TaxID=2980105 RepID=UPI00299E6CE5|nr:hypothetical protein [Exiguobacterium sp. K1]MDX1259016.1 hypothetical protein [Exiguobacterium sp. K1]